MRKEEEGMRKEEGVSTEKILRWCKIVHRLTLLLVAVTVILPFVFWGKIPDRIPSHFNGAGAADAWSDKSSLILLPVVILFLLGMMCIVEYFIRASGTSPNASAAEKQNLRTVYPMIVLMNFFMQLMFSYILFCSAACMELGKWFLPVFLVLTFLPLALLFWGRRDKSGEWKDEKMTRKQHFIEREKQEKGECYWTRPGVGIFLLPMMIWMGELCISRWIERGKPDLLMLVTSILVIGTCAPLFFIRYTLYKDHMVVDCTLFGKERIPYKDITGIKPTYNPLSSAALSIKRIQIDYTKNGRHEMVLISPVKRDVFIRKVKEKMEAWQ